MNHSYVKLSILSTWKFMLYWVKTFRLRSFWTPWQSHWCHSWSLDNKFNFLSLLKHETFPLIFHQLKLVFFSLSLAWWEAKNCIRFANFFKNILFRTINALLPNLCTASLAILKNIKSLDKIMFIKTWMTFFSLLPLSFSPSSLISDANLF